MTDLRREEGDKQENSADLGQAHPAEDGAADGSGVRRFSDAELRWAGIAVDSLHDTGDPAHKSAADSGADTAGLVASFRGEQAAARVSGARRALEDASTAWWSAGLVPNPTVLRDGLLLLNAGHEMDDAHRALLLRTALHHRRGILTAISHQVDAERTSLILYDAIVDPDHTFPLQELERLIKEDPSYEVWEPYLHAELLATARAYDPVRRRRAELGLALLDGEPWPLEDDGIDHADAFDVALFDDVETDQRRPRWPFIAAILLALTVAAVAVFLRQYERTRIADMIELTAGVYTLSNGDGTVRISTVPTYLIDSMEITNAQYQHCVKQGACPPPAAKHSATRTRYFDEPAFGDYPVIFVDHGAAERYCTWAGKRLPSVDEWQLAASLAPATQRTYAFPWGDRYVSGAANDANAAHGDTLAVGEFRPSGRSPLGLSDMAGNVAEWTASAADGRSEEYQVKGGSFADDADRVRTDDSVALASDVVADWIGFRCATTPVQRALARQFQSMTSPADSN